MSKWRSLDGSNNNLAHPAWGRIGMPYLRVTRAAFADGIAEMDAGPPPRYISNRIFNDVGQNLFSENGVSQWGWVWGQFLDHTFGLRQRDAAGEGAASRSTPTIRSNGSTTTSARSTFGARPRRLGPAALRRGSR